MSDKNTQQAASRLSFNGWSLAAVSIALLMVLPIGAVVYLALFPTENIWPHMLATTLPRYMRSTVALMLATGGLAAIIGTVTAWLVVMFDFPGRRWLQWALLMPLAVPAYVGAYALVDFLEYAGPVQTGLRQLMGWQNARDYWFPQIRSMEAAIFVIAMALYPYVYLLVRAALREQSAAGYEVARALGAGPLRRFRTIAIPLSRPAVAAGAALVMMEAVSDFGTVDYFAVQTLTTGIFSVWQQQSNLGGAAQIACLVLVVVVSLLALERISRRRARYHAGARESRPIAPTPIGGVRKWGATLICAFPVLAGFVLPVGVLLSHARHAEAWAGAGLPRALWHSISTSGAAALICVGLALILVYAVRLTGRESLQRLLPITGIGYAAPGAVLGLGILIPMAAVDHWLADRILAITGSDPGLLLSGTAFAVIMAYSIRFFAIAQGAADGALGRIAPSVPMAARLLGHGPGAVLRRVYAPIVRGSLGSAILLVFVDGIKELPATLMLRPFGYNTLATRVYEKASLENLSDAAPAALMICTVGLLAVGLLARANR